MAFETLRSHKVAKVILDSVAVRTSYLSSSSYTCCTNDSLSHTHTLSLALA